MFFLNSTKKLGSSHDKKSLKNSLTVILSSIDGKFTILGLLQYLSSYFK